MRIGKQLYLFDPQLGVAIPGPGQTGIATLEQAQTDASVLRRMNVPGWFEDYPVSKDKVSKVLCLIDADPEFLSYRMRVLEGSLTGDRRTRISVNAADLAKRFSDCVGVENVGLWSVPFDAALYHQALKRAQLEDPALAQFYLLRWGMVQMGQPLAAARWQHLIGNLQGEDDQQGALMLYQKARYTDKEIAELRFNIPMQIVLGVRRNEGESAEMFEQKIGLSQQILKESKLVASFWLGQMLIDVQRFDTAAHWLGPRYLESGGKGRIWEPQAQFCLARTLELTNKASEAIEIYRTPLGTPSQQHANRLRARLIERAMPTEDKGGESLENTKSK